jgi:hypothetical protein
MVVTGLLVPMNWAFEHLSVWQPPIRHGPDSSTIQALICGLAVWGSHSSWTSCIWRVQKQCLQRIRIYLTLMNSIVLHLMMQRLGQTGFDPYVGSMLHWNPAFENFGISLAPTSVFPRCRSGSGNHPKGVSSCLKCCRISVIKCRYFSKFPRIFLLLFHNINWCMASYAS